MKNIKGRDKYIQKNQERVLREFINEIEIDLLDIPEVRNVVMEYFKVVIMDQLEKEMDDKIIFKIDVQKITRTKAEMAETLRKIADLIDEGYDSGMVEAWRLSKEIQDEPEEARNDMFTRIREDNNVLCEQCDILMKPVKRPDTGNCTIITIYKCPQCSNTTSKQE